VFVRRKIARVVLLLLAAVPLSGCVWLQNEFFVWDAPPPAKQPAGGLDAPW
jgi:hypothetical protein